MQKYLTVFADASFKNHVAGFGMYARHLKHQHPFSISVPMTYRVESNSTAETYALGSAILLSYEHFQPERGTTIVASSDSEHALRILAGAGALGNTLEQQFARQVRQLGHPIRFRHVKGHNPKGELPRDWVNKHCDHMAWKARLEAEEHFRQLKQSKINRRARSEGRYVEGDPYPDWVVITPYLNDISHQ